MELRATFAYRNFDLNGQKEKPVLELGSSHQHQNIRLHIDRLYAGNPVTQGAELYKDAGGFISQSGEFETQLETKNNEKPNIGSFPDIATNKTTGEEVLQARIKQLFELGTKEAMLSADTVFKDPSNYFIVNYDRRDKYEAGHIPGAIRYKPKGTLGIEKEMATFPVNKDIVIYCGTGHNSGFVTAYLRLFGYNAHTLIYGNNSFMHDKMISEKEKLSCLPFTESLIKNYPVL